MSKLFVSTVVVLALAGCASTPTELASSAVATPISGEPVAALAAGEEPGAVVVSNAPAQAVNMAQFAGKTVCEDVKVTGSRMVIERRCYTRDATDPQAAYREEVVALEVEELRRQQAAMERVEREREAARQRASIMGMR